MNKCVIVRGGGDIATGTIYKLVKSGFQVLVLEVEKPSAIRRNVAFCQAVYEGKFTVEDMTCVLVSTIEEAKAVMAKNQVAMMVDPNGEMISKIEHIALVDAILAKKNLGTTIDMAPITIGLGPGFNAGKDVDIVIETMRGHRLGRLIEEGPAMKNTGIPGLIKGYGKERVIHSPGAGTVKHVRHLTDIVKKGEVIAYVDQTPIYATMDGLLRGLIKEGFVVTQGFKIADIDPREDEYENCFTISDKARCIAGGVIEAIFYLRGHRNDLS